MKRITLIVKIIRATMIWTSYILKLLQFERATIFIHWYAQNSVYMYIYVQKAYLKLLCSPHKSSFIFSYAAELHSSGAGKSPPNQRWSSFLRGQLPCLQHWHPFTHKCSNQVNIEYGGASNILVTQLCF
jgi:hypothetical protein